MAMDTLYDYHVWQPHEDEEHDNVTISNSHLLPCDCFLLHLHFRHVLHSNSPQESSHTLLNSSLSSFLIPCDAFFARASTILIAVFSGTGVAQDFLDAAIPDVLSVAADIACNPLNAGRRMLPLAVSVLVVSPHDEREEIGRVSRESAQAFKTCPASESSIEALKTVKIDAGRELLIGECRICLDELMSGMEVTRLPCSHVYHRDCIVKWLETSHLCPLCRYALPLS